MRILYEKNLEFDFDDGAAIGSYEECIAPTDAQQWIYDRARGQSSLQEFMSKNENIMEEEEDSGHDKSKRRDSENFQLPELNEFDKTRLLSCIEEIRNIIGEVHSDRKLTEIILAHDYDFEGALRTLLKEEESNSRKIKEANIIEKGMKIDF